MKTKNHVMIFFSYLGMLFLCDGSFFCVCVYVSETFSGGSEQINLTCCRLFCQCRKVLGKHLLLMILIQSVGYGQKKRNTNK